MVEGWRGGRTDKPLVSTRVTGRPRTLPEVTGAAARGPQRAARPAKAPVERRPAGLAALPGGCACQAANGQRIDGGTVTPATVYCSGA